MKRKTISFILALIMVLSLMPAVPAYATSAGPTVGASGDCPTLGAALVVAEDGDTITILSNVTEVELYEFDTTDKIITIDGGGKTITGVADTTSAALKIKGTGIVKLKNLTLQGGATSTGDSIGLEVSGSASVENYGTVNSYGGNTSNHGTSYGVVNHGTGTVTVTSATGGTSNYESCGVRNVSAGTVNAANATGGTTGVNSCGVVNEGSGTVNVINATAGEAPFYYSNGVINWNAGTVNVTNVSCGNAERGSTGVLNASSGKVNAAIVTSGTANTRDSYGVYSMGGGTINVTNATAGSAANGESYGAYAKTAGTVKVTTANYGTAVTSGDVYNDGGTIETGGTYISTLTLNKGTGASCVLDSITVASSGNTTIGALPNVSKNGVVGDWYTDIDKTTAFNSTTVNGATTTMLYSTFYEETYTISTIANQTMSTLTSGYGSGTQETKTLTITRTGTGNLESLATALSGANAASFIITQPAITTLDSGTPSTTFLVKAKDGLAAGTYTATVTISATNMNNQTFIVTQVVNAASSSGGSGGGSGSSNTSNATTVINTNTGSVTATQLKNAVDVAKDGGTVTINSNKTSEVTLSNSGLDSLAGKNNSLTVATENGTLTFNSKAVAAMGTQATATEIKVIVDDVVKTTLTEEQQTKVGDKTVYDLSVISGGKLISSFNGGKVNVSIPYELKTGETAENLTVWYMADNGSLTEINCTYDTKTKSVTFVVDHFSKYLIGYNGLADWVNPFTDVKSSAWYYDAVAFVNRNGLMKGKTDTTFESQEAMTRGMFVTILGRMEGIDATMYANKNTFSDVKSNQYYSPYIAWATDKGIVSGMGGDKFAPNASVTREQMAVMMMNYMKFKGQGPTGEWAIQLTYSDLDQVSSWANEAVMFMTMKDLMNGMGNTAKGNPLFAPKSTSTRAQTAQAMMSLGELVK